MRKGWLVFIRCSEFFSLGVERVLARARFWHCPPEGAVCKAMSEARVVRGRAVLHCGRFRPITSALYRRDLARERAETLVHTENLRIIPTTDQAAPDSNTNLSHTKTSLESDNFRQNFFPPRDSELKTFLIWINSTLLSWATLKAWFATAGNFRVQI